MDLYQNKYYKYKQKYLKLKEQLGGSYEVAAFYVETVLKQINEYNRYFVDTRIKKYMSILNNILIQFNKIPKDRFDIKFIKDLEQIINKIISINDKALSENMHVSTIITNAKPIIPNLNELIKEQGGPQPGRPVSPQPGRPVSPAPQPGRPVSPQPGPQVGQQVPQRTVLVQPDQIKLNVSESKIIIKPKSYITKFIGAGAFGCTISPPILFYDNDIIICQHYPNNSVDLLKFNENYIAKILSHPKRSNMPDAYLEELRINLFIKQFDKQNNYTPKLEFAAYLNKRKLREFIVSHQNDANLSQIFNCLSKFFQRSNTDKYYGYLVFTKVGKSFDKLNNGDIDKQNINKILTSLNEGVQIFINNLYNNNYIHSDIKIDNMTLKENKVYFIDFGVTHRYDDFSYMSISHIFNFPLILGLFYYVYSFNTTFVGNKQKYIALLRSHISTYFATNNALQKIIQNNNNTKLNHINKLYFYIDDYISNYLFSKINNNQSYTMMNIYDLILKPIKRNSDIYGISLFLFQLFFAKNLNLSFRRDINPETFVQVENLYIDALYNRITDPNHLSKRINDIIIKEQTRPQPGRPVSPQPGRPVSPQPGRPVSPAPQPGRPVSPQPGRPVSLSLVNNKQALLKNKYNLEFIAKGGFGCVLSPPLLFNTIAKQDYPPSNTKLDINSFDHNYVGKLLNCRKDSYRKELNEYALVEKFDKNGDYTPKLIFAGYMNRQELVSFIERDMQNTQRNSHLYDVYACLLEKFKTEDGRMYPNYGYIISTKVGKSFEKITMNEMNKNNIKTILGSLNDAIKNFITKLYEKDYIHGDIKLPNITLKNNKVYFIDFGLMHDSKIIQTNNGYSLNFNYPIILSKFYSVMNKYKQVTKRQLIELLIREPIPSPATTSLLLTYFKDNKNFQMYMNNYFNKLFETLNDNVPYDINFIYQKYILSVAKNCDIYALSLCIYNIFFGGNVFFNNILAYRIVGQNTNNLVNKLFNDALYNRIDGPNDLSQKLDEIINSIS